MTQGITITWPSPKPNSAVICTFPPTPSRPIKALFELGLVETEQEPQEVELH